MNIQVKVEISKTELAVYTFTTFDANVVFDRFSRQFKPEGKRVWSSETLWDARDLKSSKLKSVELPNDVKLSALVKFVELIQIKTWEEWKASK